MTFIDLLFSILALVAVGGALGLAFARHPISGAVNLVATMLALAGIYGLLDAPFLAVIQVLVYAGAIMVLVVLAIMVVGAARSTIPRGGLLSGLAALAAAIPAALIAVACARAGLVAPAGSHPVSVTDIARVLFDTSGQGSGLFLLVLTVGLLLLAAMVGAVVLAGRREAAEGGVT